MKTRRLWLCVPPILFALCDYAVTMWGQPKEYWAGDYESAIEANPLVLWCMNVHPALFHGLTFVWIASFCTLILKTPRVLARVTSLTISYTHASCAGTWLYREPDDFFVALALCIGSSIAYILGQEMSGDEKT